MSKQKNVYPGHYKTRGSRRQGEEVVQERHRERLSEERAELERKGEEHDQKREEGDD